MTTLSYLTVETGPNPTASVIWLHGLGASGHDFEPIVPEFKLKSDVRFIFPHAPNLRVTVNGGMVMPAWYDIISIDLERVIDEKQIRASADAVSELIEQEIQHGITSERIIIAGFSQGGAVAYETALSYPKPLAGIIALSSYFATHKTITLHQANSGIPIFIGHGIMDTIVHELLGQQAHQLLSEQGYNTNYQQYPVPHSVCMQEIEEIGQWLNKLLKP